MGEEADGEDYHHHQGVLVRPDHADESVSGHIIWKDHLMDLKFLTSLGIMENRPIERS